MHKKIVFILLWNLTLSIGTWIWMKHDLMTFYVDNLARNYLIGKKECLNRTPAGGTKNEAHK